MCLILDLACIKLGEEAPNNDKNNGKTISVEYFFISIILL